jgi:DNA-binding IclR family transcriptional regulator
VSNLSLTSLKVRPIVMSSYTLFNNAKRLIVPTIQSVERALHLLSLVACSSEPAGVRELARRAQLTAPTAQNLLKTLAGAGFVHFDERTRKYSIGFSAVQVADSADPMAAIRAVAHPFVTDLQRVTGATAVLMSRWHGRYLVADWCAPEEGLAVRMCGRMVEHPFGMATGRVLMAWNTAEPAGADQEQRECLRRIRKEGVAVTENLGDSGVYAVAGPVVDGFGRVGLALGCSASLFGLGLSEKEALRADVVSACARLASAMRPFGALQ